MSSPRPVTTTQWLIGGAVAGGLVLSVLSLVAVPASPDGTFSSSESTRIGMVLADLSVDEENETLQAELSLKDPTPLFLPTPRNSGHVDARMTADQAPGSSFDGFGAKLWYPVAANDLDLPDVVEIPDGPLVALDDADQALRVGELSRADFSENRLAPRQAVLQVLSVTRGDVVYETVLEGTTQGAPLNAPVEAVLAINSDGLQLRPTVIESPVGANVDLDQVDLWLKEARLESVLRPGFYRILLGP